MRAANGWNSVQHEPMKIAVIGAGIAGLGSAWALSRKHEVRVFEAASRPGGHANTRAVEVDGRAISVDTGFIVFNRRNYPLLTGLFAELGVDHHASDMSFSVSLGDGDYEYQGSLRGLFCQPANLFRPAHWRMIREVLRFYRTAPLSLSEDTDDEVTLGDLLDSGGYSSALAHRHILPMGAAIWSASMSDMRAFPARRFVRFFANHGLFDLSSRPRWRTVAGGSHTYVNRLTEALGNRLCLSSGVRAMQRTETGVTLITHDGQSETFDQVVMATHADQALRILGDQATMQERVVLGGFGYRGNRAILHTDPRLMPRRRGAWASWNYLGDKSLGEGDGQICVSYWMNRLQRLDVPSPVIVTLNPIHEPDPRHVLYETAYDHPTFDIAADRAQEALPGIQGSERIWFCGSYCGDGFHEDALRSGFDVADALGAPVPWRRAPELEPSVPDVPRRPVSTPSIAEAWR